MVCLRCADEMSVCTYTHLRVTFLRTRTELNGALLLGAISVRALDTSGLCTLASRAQHTDRHRMGVVGSSVGGGVRSVSDSSLRRRDH